MQKKTLAVACSAILGLATGGGGDAFASAECQTHREQEKCRATDGSILDVDGGVWGRLFAAGPGSVLNAQNVIVAYGADSYVLDGVEAMDGGTVNITSTGTGPRSTIHKIRSGGGSTINISNSTITGESKDPWRRPPYDITGWETADWGLAPSVGAFGGSVKLDDVDVTGYVQLTGGGRLTINGGSIKYHPGIIPERYYNWGAVRLSADYGNYKHILDASLTDVDILGEVYIDAAAGNATITGGRIESRSHNDKTRGMNAVTMTGSATTTIDGTSIISENGGHGIAAYSGANVIARNFNVTINNNNANSPVIGIVSFDEGGGQVVLENGRVQTEGDDASGIGSDHWRAGSRLSATNLTIVTTGDRAHGARIAGGTITLDDVDITVNSADGIHASQHKSDIQMKGGSISVNGPGGYGVLSDTRDNNIKVMLNGVNVAIGADSYALGFIGSTRRGQGNFISLEASTATAAQSTAVMVKGGVENVLDLLDSTLEGDRLVQVEAGQDISGQYQPSNLFVSADRSKLYGHATIDSTHADGVLTLGLKNNSTWTLRPSSGGVVHSDVSTLNLVNSTIHFDQNASGLYQTLAVGRNATSPIVYHADGDAEISLNTWLNEGGALSNQQTDRLLINGDVSGKTWIAVKEVAGSPGGLTGSGADKGISIVQVSGTAQKDSFALKGGYVTMDAKPYRYQLMAYGPSSANGDADQGQRLVGGGNPHWDYRLQSDSFVPQVPSYRDAFNEMAKSLREKWNEFRRRLREQLNRRQTGRYQQDVSPWGALDDNGSFLLMTGGSESARVNLGASLTHSALMGGRTLYSVEGSNSLLQLGVVGSSGSLSFLPNAATGVHRTRLEQRSIAPTFSWRSRNGGYVDAIMDYGHFNGAVSTVYRGETARLRGRTQMLSVETGLPVTLGDWALMPQAQIAWQRARFDNVQDVDGFPVQLGAPQQWTLRAGGEVNKALFADHGRHGRLYGRLHLTHGVGDGNTVWLGEAFHLDGAGNTLEGTLGVDASWRGGNTSFYADISHHQRLGHKGMQGSSANVGLRVGF